MSESNSSVIEISSAAEFQPYISACQELAEVSREKNIFYEPFMLEPALNYLDTNEVTLLLVFSNDGSHLSGLFPLVYKKKYLGLPIPHYSMWRHQHCFLTNPLLRPEDEEACYEKLLDWLETQAKPNWFMSFDRIYGDGETHQKLMTTIHHQRCALDKIGSYKRAFLSSKLSADEYMHQWGAKRRKSLRQNKAALSRQGTLTMRTLVGTDITSADCEQWTEQFLELEKGGWKGREGTAMACDDSEARFFKQLSASASSCGKLLYLRYDLNDTPIAMQINFISGTGAFAFKVAYDETYRKQGPGSLLEVEALRFLLDNAANVEWIDSCATEGSGIEHFWKERRIISHFHISQRNMKSRMVVRVLAFLRKAKRMLKNRSN